MADVEAFIKAPSQESLGTFSKEQLLLIAEHFSVSIVGDKRMKENIKDSIVSTLKKFELEIEKEIAVERIRQESEKAKLEMEGHRLSILRDGALFGEGQGEQ
ncbi:hypothetical protein F7725_001798, partial [Dissostichus mawsoni]